MRRFFNKLAAGVMVATMAFTALAPVTTMAAGNDHTHSFTTATTTPSTSDKDDKNPSTSTTPSTSDKDSDTIPIKETLAKVGTKYTIGGNQYTVIKADGISYKVTEVGANAFKNNKNVKKVVIGANVVKIANKAFNKCPNLKSVVIKTTLLTKKTASKKCFSKVNKKMVIKVSKKSKKTYAKIFKGLKVR